VEGLEAALTSEQLVHLGFFARFFIQIFTSEEGLLQRIFAILLANFIFAFEKAFTPLLAKTAEKENYYPHSSPRMFFYWCDQVTTYASIPTRSW
jgi:hypothetical protein